MLPGRLGTNRSRSRDLSGPPLSARWDVWSPAWPSAEPCREMFIRMKPSRRPATESLDTVMGGVGRRVGAGEAGSVGLEMKGLDTSAVAEGRLAERDGVSMVIVGEVGVGVWKMRRVRVKNGLVDRCWERLDGWYA